MSTRFFGLSAGRVMSLMALMFLVMLTATAASAASAGELLEKAIYTEETVGNVDDAMKLYEQVIAEGKASQHAAAQAQYRLGLCYLKKNQEPAATAAFRALVENYPAEKELIAKASKHLPSAIKLLDAPWTDGERMQLDMKLPTGIDIGTMIYMIDAEKHEGKSVWRCTTRGLVTVNDAASYSTVLCDKESFAPISSLWKHSLLGEAKAVYKDTEAEVTAAGRSAPFTIAYTAPVFDNEECVELFRRLPLKTGYKTSIPVVTSLGGSKIELVINVPVTEKLVVPAGTFECFKLDLNIGQTFWISNDEHRYVVRFAAGGVIADLAKVEVAKPGQPERISGEDFSVTAPAGWFTYKPEKSLKKDETSIFLLDPRADARAQIAVQPKRSLKEDHRKSPKAWIESVSDDFKNVFADFEVRKPGVSEQQVGGQAAATMIADFTKDNKKMTLYAVAVLGQKSAATLHFTTDADKFEAFRKDFDKIVENFNLE
jgi:hypothetical protein